MKSKNNKNKKINLKKEWRNESKQFKKGMKVNSAIILKAKNKQSKIIKITQSRSRIKQFKSYERSNNVIW